MERPRYPVLTSAGRGVFPSDRQCPACGAQFGKGFAYLSGGSLLLTDDNQNSIHTDQLKAFLHLGFHGTDPEMRDSADLMLAEDVLGGQFDLHWCSLRCMREWITRVLDDLEKKCSGDCESA